MLRLPALLPLLLTSTVVFAQAQLPSLVPLSPIDPATSPVIFKPLTPATGCPVGLSAQRQGSTQMLLAKRGINLEPAGPAQGLHLSLTHLNAPAIDSIVVTVYATSTNARVIPADSLFRNQQSGLISKTFELHRDFASASLKEADVWMHQVGSLRWVDLISINYTDGTTWHATENSRCRVEPSNFVLIGQK